MDRRTINIPEKDIDKIKLPPDGNNVIIEITERSKDKKTIGGVLVGFNEDVVYAEGLGSHAADVAESWGTVFKAPEELYYRERLYSSMPWKTEIEIKEGDTVWFSYYESVNCDVMLCGDRTFYVIPYQNLYVAKRDNEIITLNGYCLCEPIPDINDSPYAIDTREYKKDRVIIRYKGGPNDAYQPNDVTYGTYNNDDIEIEVGDEVLLRHNCPLVFLERLQGIATFSKEPYYVVQRRRMEMVL